MHAANLVNYQGKLYDSLGQPLTGAHAITFSVYDTASGSSPLWQETQSVTLGDDGVYSVLLGSVAPFPAGLFQGDDRYLGIAVGGEELTPRAYVGFAPQALMAASLPAGAVTSDNLADNAVTAPKIALGAVGSREIAAGAVGSEEIIDYSISADDLAADSVTSNAIAHGAVGSAQLANESVSRYSLQQNSVTAAAIDTGAVGAGEIADGSVGSTDIADHSISSDDLGPNSVTAYAIAAGAVGASEIEDGSIAAADLAANSVGTSELIDGAVTNGKLADEAVTSGKLAANSVTASAIAAGAVGASEIADRAVSSEKQRTQIYDVSLASSFSPTVNNVGLIFSTAQTVITLPDPATMPSQGFTFLAVGSTAYVRLLSPSAPFSTGEDHVAIWQEDRAVRVLSLGDQWMILDSVSSKPLVLYEWTGYRRGGFVFSDPVPCEDGGNAPAKYGNYRIFISTSSVPVADLADEYGIPTDVPILSKTGEKLADDWADLTDGSIDQTLVTAGVSTVSSYFWTGGLDAATACTDWTTTTGSGTIGYDDATDSNWIDYTTQTCDFNRALLCIAWP